MSNWPRYHDEALSLLNPNLAELEDLATRTFLTKHQIDSVEKLIDLGPMGVVKLEGISGSIYSHLHEFLVDYENIFWPRYLAPVTYLRANDKFYEDLKGQENKDLPIRRELLKALERRLFPSLETLILHYTFDMVRAFAAEVSPLAYAILIDRIENYESLTKELADWL